MHKRAGSIIGAMLLLPAPAHAAPIDFECDVPPNRASLVDQGIAGPAGSLTGKMSFMLARGGRYAPSATVKIASGDDSQSIALQIVGTEPATYNRAAASDPRYTVYLVSKSGAGEASRLAIGKLDPASTDLAFAVSVAADGAATASIGSLAGKAKLAPLTAPKTRLLCSSGQFSFKGVEAR
jgi:hypothetical protein